MSFWQKEGKWYKSKKVVIPLIISIVLAIGTPIYQEYLNNLNTDRILKEVAKCQIGDYLSQPKSLEECAKRVGLTSKQIIILAENRLEISNNEYVKGTSALIIGNFSKALFHFNKSVILNPDNTDIWSDISVVTYHMGLFEDTINACDEVIKRLPNDVHCLYGKGAASLMSRRYQDAIDVYSRILILNTDFQKAYDNRGYAYFQLGKYNLALNDFNISLKLDGENPFVCRISNIGDVLLAMGKPEEAKKYFSWANETNPNFISICYNVEEQFRVVS